MFEELLIDHETASNAGNWQWLSCTAFYSQYYRIYSPIAFGAKTDPEGLFVRRYCPELAKLDRKYIYEPWKAPVGELKRAGVRLVEWYEGQAGVDSVGVNSTGNGVKTYPKPMFDFPSQRTKCLAGMKEAYSINLYGNDPKVMNGSWKGLFKSGGIGILENTESKIKAEGGVGVSVGMSKRIEDIKDLVLGMGKKATRKEEGSEDLLRENRTGDDGGIEENAEGAAEMGGESKGGDKPIPSRSQQLQKKGKRKGAVGQEKGPEQGQGTLDEVFKRVRR